MGGRVHAFVVVEDDGLTLIDTMWDTDGHHVLEAIATWPTLDAGWYAFNLIERQHRESIHRMAELETDVLWVGRGDPLTTNVADQVRSLAT